jgi:hypothetical protein
VLGTLRRDGSSNFGRDYRWGTFLVGLGWIVSNGDFMANVKGIGCEMGRLGSFRKSKRAT